MATIRSPFGAADSQTPAYAATIAVSITNDKTIITPGTLTGNATLNLTIDDEVDAGAEIILIATADGTKRTITTGDGFNASTPNLPVKASQTYTATYVYNGTSFYEKSEPTGIDAEAVTTNSTNVSELTDATTVRTGRVQNSATEMTPETGVTAVHYGNGSDITTVLTLTDVDLGAVAGAGAAASGAKIAEFPAGAHLHELTHMSVGVVGDAAVQSDEPDIGIGSIIATGEVSVLGGTATFEDYITGQTMTDVNGTASVAMTAATAGALTGISINGASDVKDVHLNIADTWAGASASLLASGTIIIKWNKIV